MIKKHLQTNISSQNGFTIVESLVAISVLLTAIAGPLTMSSFGLTTARLSQQQIVATYLAQEVVEFVRNQRDTNILSGHSDWLQGLDECIGSVKNCIIDVQKGVDEVDGIEECMGINGVCDPLQYNATLALYGHDSGSDWEDTLFTRSVNIVPMSGVGDEVQVTARVSWKVGARSHEVVIQDSLFRWPR